jgi:hypothetical protein
MSPREIKSSLRVNICLTKTEKLSLRDTSPRDFCANENDLPWDKSQVMRFPHRNIFISLSPHTRKLGSRVLDRFGGSEKLTDSTSQTLPLADPAKMASLVHILEVFSHFDADANHACLFGFQLDFCSDEASSNSKSCQPVIAGTGDFQACKSLYFFH